MDDLNPVLSPVKPNLKLEKHGEEEKVDATLFKLIVGSLRYLCNSIPDIRFSIGLVSRYMDVPKVLHMKVARRIPRYLEGSINCGILFPRDYESKEVVINWYSYTDWCEDKEDRRSTNDYYFQVFGALTSWCSRKKLVVALSLCETEYIAGFYASCKEIWIRSVLDEMRVKVKNSLVPLIDNKSVINLA